MKELLFSLTKKDFKWETFRCGGKGGQNVNKRNTGSRVIHEPSGAVAESREFREFNLNRKNAFKKLCNSDKFRAWIRTQAYSLSKIEEKVNELMDKKYLLVEIKQDGKWVINDSFIIED